MRPQKHGNKIRYSPQGDAKPATGKGFRFLNNTGDKMGTRKNVHYKPAKLYSKGDKWFVYFSFRDPSTDKFKRFKVYEDINQIKGEPDYKLLYAQNLVVAVNEHLKMGYNPFKTEPVKQWSLIQGLNYYKQKIPEMGLRNKSIQNYNSLLEIVSDGFKPFHQVHLNHLPAHTCRAALSDLARKRGWGNVRYNNVVRFCRQVFTFFMEHEICAHNPFKGVKNRQETKTKNQPFTAKDWELIQKEADPELKRFILFLYHTGTRPNEARQLKYEHILRERKILLVPGSFSKNKKDGYVPLSDSFFDLFPPGKGVIFGTGVNHFGNKFLELRTRLKLNSQYTLYSTKHTRAVHLAEDGASPYSIMQLFRHSSLDITMHYLRDLGINIGREAADKIR